MVPLIPVTDARQLFADLGTLVRGRHFSADSVFQSPGAKYEDATADASYYYIGGEAVAHKGARWHSSRRLNLGIAIPSDATIDSEIAYRQFAELGPLAVRYTASLIAHYLKEAESASGEQLLPPCEVLGQYEGTVEYEVQYTPPDGVCRTLEFKGATILSFKRPFPNLNYGYWDFSMTGTNTYRTCAGVLLGAFPQSPRGMSSYVLPDAVTGVPYYGIPSAGITVKTDNCYFGALPPDCGPFNRIVLKFNINQVDATGTWDFIGDFYEEHLQLSLSRAIRK
jgi:hypothetical protein